MQLPTRDRVEEERLERKAPGSPEKQWLDLLPDALSAVCCWSVRLRIQVLSGSISTRLEQCVLAASAKHVIRGLLFLDQLGRDGFKFVLHHRWQDRRWVGKSGLRNAFSSLFPFLTEKVSTPAQGILRQIHVPTLAQHLPAG